MRSCVIFRCASALALCLLAANVGSLLAQERVLHTFKRQQLSDVYYSEGANAGDLNHDGKPDIVYGPYWYEGPTFENKHEIYAPKPQNKQGYSDNFFSWVYDFNGDGWNDVFVVGFPATPAYVYENPKGTSEHWAKHQVFDAVANESPHFVNLLGDDRPELVCTHNGFFGYASIDKDHPLEAWKFHAVSDKSAPEQFGHGLGVGDINGDGRLDILQAAGWFEQPEKNADGRWPFHPASFTNAYGGAEMYAYDVDGDGDNDVITSLAAHDFGLAWYEQVRDGKEITFRQHLIMGAKPEQNRYGVVFSELHSVNLADIDGDGLKDIVTGKTYYSHHQGSPMWDAGAVVYWFRLVRSEKGVDWVPYKADGEAGIGRQVSVADVNGDKLPDIIVGGMKGAHVLLHEKKNVSEKEYKAAQPKVISPDAGKSARGKQVPLDGKGHVPGALEGESLTVVAKSVGEIAKQNMQGFTEDHWSGNEQLFWNGAKPGATLQLELPVETTGTYHLTAACTMARDYAKVQLGLDDASLGDAIDLFNDPGVVSTGVLDLGKRDLTVGKHKLTVEIQGANPAAVKAYMFGLDYIRLEK